MVFQFFEEAKMVRRCYCKRCEMDTEDAEMVVEGIPMCDADCIHRARQNQQRSIALQHTRIGGSYIGRKNGFDVIGD